MHGHCDFSRIMMWCNLIGRIFSYARNTPYNTVKDFIVSLNTTSAYEHFLGTVFGPDMREFAGGQQELEEGVLDVKYGLFDNKAPKPKATKKLNLGEIHQAPIANFFVQVAQQAADNRFEPQMVVMENIEVAPQWPAPNPAEENAVREFIERERQRLVRDREHGLRPIRLRNTPR